MNQSPRRTPDIVVYVIAFFFFSCIVVGGVFLALYLFFPVDQSQPWFPTLGLVLVAIPWLFWLFTYLYRCFSPRSSAPPPQTFHKSVSRAAESPFDNENADVDSQPMQQNNESHSISDSTAGEGRRVQFGSVIVIAENENDKKTGPPDNDHGVADNEHGSSSSLLLHKDGEIKH